MSEATPPTSRQRACDRCTQGVMDSTNSHLLGTCSCECHKGDGNSAAQTWLEAAQIWIDKGEELARHQAQQIDALEAENRRIRLERDDFEQRLHAYKSGEHG